MRTWGVKRIATLDDIELSNFIEHVEKYYGRVEQVICIGDNTKQIRIYQVLYVQED